MNTLTFECGQVIFREGDFSTKMYDIVSGKVGVYTGYGTPEEKLIAELGDDQVLGEMGMLEVYPRSATAVALKAGTTLAELGEEELSIYFRSKPEKLLRIMKQLAQRIRDTNEKYINACRAAYETVENPNTAATQNEWLKSELDKIFEECDRASYH